ncbi:MAG: lipopolysaccharide kinase InaA family protein [Vicinamibacterales bacterium]
MREHGRLKDGRVYLITSLFDELPLATIIDAERAPSRLVGHIRTTIEIARVLADLHWLPIYHVDLNPMNILYRSEKGMPIIRIVDFESSYEPARHANGRFYDPPTTPHFSAPEVSKQPPDARADIYSLGAVLYMTITGYGWTCCPRCVHLRPRRCGAHSGIKRLSVAQRRPGFP